MPLRGSGSASAAVRPYFLDGTLPSIGGHIQRARAGRADSIGRPYIFWIQSPFAFLCDVLHIRVALTKPSFHRPRQWMEGDHAFDSGG